MFLSSLFSKYKKSKEYYFGLFLKGDEAVGLVFEVSENNLIILDTERSSYSNGWENIVEDIDDLIFKLESKTKQHLKDVIFFTYSYFIDENSHEIKQPYKDIIKSLLKKLELKPLGYIECFEAVASYLGRRDNIPLNAILIELDKHNVDICIYKSGRKIFAKNSSRTNNLIEDMTSMFDVLKGQVLPSRIVLYDAADLHDESTKIIAHKWDEEIFVQPPRVEVVKEDKLYKELGEIFVQQLFADSSESNMQDVTTEPAETIAEDPESEPENTVPASEEEPAETTVVETPHVAGGVMGFVIGKDISASKSVQPKQAEVSQESSFGAETDSEEVTGISRAPRKSFIFPTIRMPHIQMKGFFKYAWIVGIIMIVASLFSIEYYFHKAHLTVLLPAKSLSKKIDINTTIGSTSSTGPNILTGTYTASVDDSSSTTGKRDLGEKARGDVMLHNFSDSDKLISKGTVLVTEGKSFVLDQDVKIASASESIVDGGLVKQPGKSKGTVLASTLGPEGNIAKSKRFAIGDLPSSTYFAINESAFSGGTRKSIKTVSRDDIEGLKKSALEKAKKENGEEIKKKLGKNDVLIDALTEAAVSDSTLSKELGEEADELTMQAKVDLTYYYFDGDQLKKELAEDMKAEAPSDFQIVTDKLTFSFDNVKKDEDDVSMVVNAHTVSVKEVSTEAILSKVIGKKKSDLDSVLRSENGVSGYHVDIKSPIVVLDQWMPFFKNNIKLDTSTL
ncbi:MAG: hypothetical protein RI947_407 [Candidatus Parcubacteria bacterium]|jgi:hypothetical protein